MIKVNLVHPVHSDLKLLLLNGLCFIFIIIIFVKKMHLTIAGNFRFDQIG